MLFNFKSSRFISVVLASSAFCSNSLVSADTDANTMIHAKLKYLDKGGIPDGVKNIKLFNFFANDLKLNGVKEGIDHEPGKVSVGDWFRDMMYQCFETFDSDTLRTSAMCIYRYVKYNYKRYFFDYLVQREFQRSLRESKNDEIKKHKKMEVCGIYFNDCLYRICRSFDMTKVSKRGDYDVEYWEIMKSFFKSLLFDISKKSLDCGSDFGSVDINKICLSHVFILIVDLFKCFGVEKKEKIDLDSVYNKNITNLKGLRDQLGNFFDDNDCRRKIDEMKITIPCDELCNCASAFISFIYTMVFSMTLHKLI